MGLADGYDASNSITMPQVLSGLVTKVGLCLLIVHSHERRTRLVEKLTPNVHSSRGLNPPEVKRFRVKLTNLNISKIDLVEVFIDLLEAENPRSKNLAEQYTAFMKRSRTRYWHCAASILLAER